LLGEHWSNDSAVSKVYALGSVAVPISRQLLFKGRNREALSSDLKLNIAPGNPQTSCKLKIWQTIASINAHDAGV
jgi:hypothetical protein